MTDTGLLAAITRAFRGRDRRLTDLEARVVALENARPVNLADAWRGIFSVSETYHRGNLATRSGSLWLSLEDNNSEIPGRSPSWKMVVKSHR